MRITFVLPGVVAEPSGGAKIVYEYANRLAGLGHTVSVMHPRTWEPLHGSVQYLKSLVWPLYVKATIGSAIPWMAVNPTVNQLLVPDLRPRYFPEADAVIATFFRTAPPVNDLPLSRGRKFYFIQHYEDWAGPREEVDATWRLPMHKIVISRWLQDISNSFGHGENTTHIPNAMDLEAFHITQPIDSRSKRIVMLASANPFKGTREGLEVLALVRKRIPEVQAVCFGTAKRDTSIPDWIEYRELPGTKDLRDIYNSGSVFLQPSQAEGWGLTSTEAMACGCALVSTDNGGSRDFAHDGTTALVTPVGDVRAMASAIQTLMEDEILRQKLAAAGHDYVQRYSWDRAVTAFEAALVRK
jgi:glycosyltransferase involved in cell wall biosynthesis